MQVLTYGGTASAAVGVALTVTGSGGTAVSSIISVGIVLLCARFGIALFEWDAPRERRVEVGRSVAAVALVAVAGVAGAAGPAAAQTSDETTCTTVEFVYSYATSAGNLPGNECRLTTAAEVNDVQQEENNKTHTDLYNAAAASKQQATNYLNQQQNYLQDSKSVAWQQATIAIAEEYQNGSTEAQAEVAAVEAIEDYYATKQINLIAAHDTHLRSLATVEESARLNGLDGQTSSMNNTTKTVSGTLVNGTTAESLAYGDEAGYYGHNPIFDAGGSPHWTESHIDAPSGDLPRLLAYDYDRWSTAAGNIVSAKDDLTSQVPQYVNNTYGAYQDGTINASDVLSRETQAFQNGVESVDGESTYSNQLAAYSAMGLESPDLNGTGTITISQGGENMTGMLYTTGSPPNGSWEVGTTYDAGSLSGVETFVTTDGNKTDLTGNFTVERITTGSGETRQAVTVTNYTYVTSDASGFINRSKRLAELNRQIEERQALYGGGTGIGSGEVPPVALAAVAAAALLLLLGRGS